MIIARHFTCGDGYCSWTEYYARDDVTEDETDDLGSELYAIEVCNKNGWSCSVIDVDMDYQLSENCYEQKE